MECSLTWVLQILNAEEAIPVRKVEKSTKVEMSRHNFSMSRHNFKETSRDYVTTKKKLNSS